MHTSNEQACMNTSRGTHILSLELLDVTLMQMLCSFIENAEETALNELVKDRNRHVHLTPPPPFTSPETTHR